MCVNSHPMHAATKHEYGQSQSLHHHHQYHTLFSACWPAMIRFFLIVKSEPENGRKKMAKRRARLLRTTLRWSKAISEFFNLSSSSSPITIKSSWLSRFAFFFVKKEHGCWIGGLHVEMKKRKERKLRHSKLPFYEDSESSWKETRRKTFPLELRVYLGV